MIGLLVGETCMYLRSIRKVKRVPTNETLARIVHEKPGALGIFFRGAQRHSEWANRGQILLRYLLGGTGQLEPNSRTIVDRIDHFFFREFEPKIGPALFRAERHRFADPFTRTELAGELRWFARQAALNDSSRLVLVSGGQQLPLIDPVEKELGMALCDVLKTKARVEFISAPETKQSPDLAKDFEAAFSISKGRIKKPEAPEAATGFLNPVLQFLYFETSIGGRPEKILYIIRGVTDYSGRRDMPLALEGTGTELLSFELWLQKLDSRS